ncbi:MAG: Zn-ribbon containing protein [Candidatus Jordarchaeales archaeon]
MSFYNVCAACGKKIPNGHSELSCPACGSNVFKLVREFSREKVEKADEKVDEPFSQHVDSEGSEERVETVRILRRGVFEINLEALVKGAPLIVSDREGTYRIPLNWLVKTRGQK